LAAFLRKANKMKPKRWGKRRCWHTIAFVLAMMIMMVSPALSATGWYNWYNSANTTMYWMYDGNWRLAYTYGAGQWWDCTQLGGKDNWNTLGSAGQTSDFLGNASIGSYLPVGNGWRYGYDTRSDTGYWMNSAGNFRFGYNYNSGQWWDQNLNQWNQIGAASVQSPFIGDGQTHDMKNNWSYKYSYVADTEYWSTGGALRLAYQYTVGQWFAFDYLGGEQILSASGLSSTFVGDGTWHDLDNNWQYLLGGGNFGVWTNPSLNLQQFAYDYGSGQWYDQGLYGGWATLGPSGLSGAFLGDGTWHNLGSTWSYLCGGGTFGVWANPSLSLQQFSYDYGTGQWFDSGKDMTWQMLSAVGLSSTFLGDGTWHDLGNNWRYLCQAGQVGTWYNKSLNLTQFWYDYQAGKWYDQGFYGGGQTLGDFFLSTGMSCGFLGDGNWHLVGRNGWKELVVIIPGFHKIYVDHYTDYIYYKYDVESGLGQWYNPANIVVFAYDYAKSQWYSQGNYGGPTPLGSAGLSAEVMGYSRAWPSLGNIDDGNWHYWFDGSRGVFEQQIPGQDDGTRYVYDYSTGQWYKGAWNIPYIAIGSPGASPSFSGPF
jgi:hypothetical protein